MLSLCNSLLTLHDATEHYFYNFVVFNFAFPIRKAVCSRVEFLMVCRETTFSTNNLSYFQSVIYWFCFKFDVLGSIWQSQNCPYLQLFFSTRWINYVVSILHRGISLAILCLSLETKFWCLNLIDTLPYVIKKF